MTVLIFAPEARIAKWVARGRGIVRYTYAYDLHHINGLDRDTLVLVYDPSRYPLKGAQRRVLNEALHRFYNVTDVRESELVV